MNLFRAAALLTLALTTQGCDIGVNRTSTGELAPPADFAGTWDIDLEITGSTCSNIAVASRWTQTTTLLQTGATVESDEANPDLRLIGIANGRRLVMNAAIGARVDVTLDEAGDAFEGTAAFFGDDGGTLCRYAARVVGTRSTSTGNCRRIGDGSDWEWTLLFDSTTVVQTYPPFPLTQSDCEVDATFRSTSGTTREITVHATLTDRSAIGRLTGTEEFAGNIATLQIEFSGSFDVTGNAFLGTFTGRSEAIGRAIDVSGQLVGRRL